MEELGFLQALYADSSDHVARLVYADWLEEQGEPAHAFLRAEHRLLEMAHQARIPSELLAELSGLQQSTSLAWQAIVGGRWRLRLQDYRQQYRVRTIIETRKVHQQGLRVARDLVDSAPVDLRCGLTYEWGQRLQLPFEGRAATRLIPEAVSMGEPKRFQSRIEHLIIQNSLNRYRGTAIGEYQALEMALDLFPLKDPRAWEIEERLSEMRRQIGPRLLVDAIGPRYSIVATSGVEPTRDLCDEVVPYARRPLFEIVEGTRLKEWLTKKRAEEHLQALQPFVPVSIRASTRI